MQLRDRSALVIGGTHGMGAATARLLRDRGVSVTVTGSNPQNVARSRAEGIAAEVLDLGDPNQIEVLSGSFPGALDALFVFAGIAAFAPLADATADHFDRLVGVNARGTLMAVQRLLPRLRDGGSITVATVTPATATPGMGVYMASKGALRGWAQVLAAELLPRSIRVNMLAPGFIDTPTLGVAGLSTEERAELHAVGDAVTPMQRHGTMDEVARAALFLAFEATFSTGIELAVDGGLSTVDAPAGLMAGGTTSAGP